MTKKKLKACRIQVQQSRGYVAIMGTFSSCTGLIIALFNLGVLQYFGANILLATTGQIAPVTAVPTLAEMVMVIIAIASIIGGGIGIFYAIRR